MKKQLKQCIFIGAGIVICGSLIINISNPLRRSEKTIENELYRRTPVGTDMSKAFSVIEKHSQWDSEHEFLEVYDKKNKIEDYISIKEILSDDRYVLRQNTIIVDIGTYVNFFPTAYTVCAEYVFDENAQLIKIVVDKSRDDEW